MGNKRRHGIIRGILLVGIALCLIKISRIYDMSVKHSMQQNQLKKMTEVAEMPEDRMEGTEGREESPEEESAAAKKEDTRQGAVPSDFKKEDCLQNEKEPGMLSKYAALYEENNDLTGWLSIEGTEIDYPVMQCGDDEYYLHHDFYGEESKYGCLYVKQEADVDGGTNFIIYGHNMKDGSMFGGLDLYEKESFYLEHPVISFDTLYEERVYEIIAVFPSQVYNREDDVFKYYRFYTARNESEFEEFYGKIRELSLYDTGVEAAFGDTFLTLSTCAYHVKDGRFVIVAKRKDV